MSTLRQSPAWQGLQTLASEQASTANRAQTSPAAAIPICAEVGGLHLDASGQQLSQPVFDALLQLVQERKVADWTHRMLQGEAINQSEQRPVLHAALRAQTHDQHCDSGAISEALAARQRMRLLIDQACSGALTGTPVRHVINIGIGGSDNGPRLACTALRTALLPDMDVRFAANLDPADLHSALQGIDPAATLFIAVSKSFRTEETLANARRARDWLQQQFPSEDSAMLVARHFIAVTGNSAVASSFGIPAERVLPLWDWVGGRFSLWSPAGLALAFAIGMDGFEQLLAGARAMDQHFQSAPIEKNLPLLLAMVDIWNVNFRHADSHAVIPYSHDLRSLPLWLQQLEMESNGKSIDRDGALVDYATSPIVWGSAGTDSQHSYHQLLHQGTALTPVDFILPLADGRGMAADRALIANALAQATALSHPDSPTRRGRQPWSMLLIQQLDAHNLGMLLALYEHKVFAEGVIWNLNSFDQPGVEAGKRLAQQIARGVQSGGVQPGGVQPGAGKNAEAATDAALAALVKRALS